MSDSIPRTCPSRRRWGGSPIRGGSGRSYRGGSGGVSAGNLQKKKPPFAWRLHSLYFQQLPKLQLQSAKAGRVLAAFQAAAQAFLLAALGALFLAGDFFLGPHGALEGEPDFALFAVDAEDLHVKFLADFQRFFRLFDLLIGNFTDV